MSSPWKTEVLTRYVLLQIPGWILLLAGMTLVRAIFGLPVWVIWASFIAMLVKDIILYPLVWRAFARGSEDAVHPRVGAVAVVERPLMPSGTVRIRNELWQARLYEEDARVESGEEVRVREIRGLTLIVERERGG